ncbi:glucokinase [Chamaesiphon sp.]|uniref:glucokinase n=1 Tax=Chamaesiphon sp. TaxID=2814140 RepID=UPI003593F820
MKYLLAGDLGGTKTLLRLVEVGSLTIVAFERSHQSRDYPGLVAIVQSFLAAAQVPLGLEIEIVSACFGIAGAVIDGASYLPNLDWHIDATKIASILEIPQVKLINDFVAIGYGIGQLRPEDLHTIQTGQPHQNAPKAVIGAGTGLGQGFLIHNGTDYQVVAAEGGHTDFAARSIAEFELWQYICTHKQIARVSTERVVSGPGIVSIYQYLRDKSHFSETPEVANVVKLWESPSENAVDPTALISALAIAKTDPLCQATMQMFVSAYGAEAGNLALKILPYGGIYLAGGIAAKNLALFTDGTFTTAFNHKGRVSHLLGNIPVHVILTPQVGLLGAVAQAAQLHSMR